MFSKIVSQFIFTCSTFLFLSASLFSMERGEGPGEEKKSPVLSTEQKTEMSRRAEENIEDEGGDSSQGLARSMGGCQLADPTISGSQEKDQQRSSLHDSDVPDINDDMSASIPPGGSIGSPQRATRRVSAPVTPGEEEHMGQFGAHNIQGLSNFENQKAAIVSPSPGKRHPSIFNPSHLNSHSPQKLFGSPVKIIKVDPEAQAAKMSEHAEKMAGMHQAVLHGNEVFSYAEATKQAILPVYRVFKPKDAKKTDLLTQACHDRAAAQMALTMSIKNLNEFLSPTEEHSEMGVSDADLLLKLSLATTAVKATTENVKAVADGLMGDAQYGDAVNAALADLRAAHDRGVDLFDAAGSIAQPPAAAERSLFSDANQKEILQKKIETTQATLQYATELIGPVIEPAHRFFQGFREDATMSSHGDNLQALHQQLNAEMMLMKVALNQAKQYHSEFESSLEDGSRFFDALDVTTRDVHQVTEQMRGIIQHADGYDDVTMVDVPALLQKSAEINNRYQASLTALKSK